MNKYSLHVMMNLVASPLRGPRLDARSGAYNQLAAVFLQITKLRLGVLDSLPEFSECLASWRQLALQAPGQPTQSGQPSLAFAQLLLASAVGDPAVGERATFLRETDRRRVTEFRRYPASHLLCGRIFQQRPVLQQEQTEFAFSLWPNVAGVFFRSSLWDSFDAAREAD